MGGGVKPRNPLPKSANEKKPKNLWLTFLTPIICKDQKIYYRARKRHVFDFDEIWCRGVF